MKTKVPSSVLIALSAMVILAAGGCASTQPASPGRTLASAGFRLRTPETAKQKEIYANLPANRVHRLTVNGQTYYVYKDASKGIAFVGREAEYQRYRQMARQDVADANITFNEMDDAAAQSWSSEYALTRDWR